MDIQRISCDACPVDGDQTLCTNCRGTKFALIIDSAEQLVWLSPVEPSVFGLRRVKEISRRGSVLLALMLFVVSVVAYRGEFYFNHMNLIISNTSHVAFIFDFSIRKRLS